MCWFSFALGVLAGLGVFYVAVVVMLILSMIRDYQ